jgi:hypothetical protein
MKLTTTTSVPVDGVMRGATGRIRAAGADSSARMGHAAFDNEAATFLYRVYERADPFLFGRRPNAVTNRPRDVALKAQGDCRARQVSSRRPFERLVVLAPDARSAVKHRPAGGANTVARRSTRRPLGSL